MRVAMMATYKARKKQLAKVAPTIARQVDMLYVYCNGYHPHHKQALMELGDNIHPLMSNEVAGDLRDMGKTWPIGRVDVDPEYIFLVDDDILYPPDYCQRHIDSIEIHRGASTIHGRRISINPIQSYFADTQTIHFSSEVESSFRIGIAGTGTVAWKPEYTPVQAVELHIMHQYKGMCDVWFACEMNRIGCDIHVLPREKDWMVEIKNKMNRSLSMEYQRKNTEHCKFLNKYDWKVDKIKRKKR